MINKDERRLQFRRAILGLGADEVEVGLNLRPRRTAEKIAKGAIELTTEERVSKVAEMYNRGLTYQEMATSLGYKTIGSICRLVRQAREAGLIIQMRGSGNAGTPKSSAELEPTNETKIPEEPMENPPVAENATTQPVSVKTFTDIALLKLVESEKLAREAKMLREAGLIAQALVDLLGNSAADLVSNLWDKVGA